METEHETEKARSARRLNEMTTFVESAAFGRISEIQRDMENVKDSDELIVLLSGIDLSEESELSPIRDLWCLISSEMVFVQLRHPAETEYIPPSFTLDHIRKYAELRKQKVDHRGMCVQYEVLAGMQALQEARTDDALAHLAEFEALTLSAGFPEDQEYAAQMRERIRTGKTQAALDLSAKRVLGLFSQYFEEVMQAIDRKLLRFRAELDQ